MSSYVNGSEIEVGEFIVTATYTQHHESTLDLTISGEIIHTTDEHPFLVMDDNQYCWVEAQHLNIGNKVVASDGSFGVVEAITVIEEPQTMYNLTVALAHTFVVSDGQWVVHNTTSDARSIFGMPIGFNPTQWHWFQEGIRGMNNRVESIIGIHQGTYYVHGSRVNGLLFPSQAPRFNSDIDVMLRMDRNDFVKASNIVENLLTVRGVSGHVSEFRRQMRDRRFNRNILGFYEVSEIWHEEFYDIYFPEHIRIGNKKIDFSIVEQGSPFDNGALICINRL